MSGAVKGDVGGDASGDASDDRPTPVMLVDNRHVFTPYAAAAPLGAGGCTHRGHRGLLAAVDTGRHVPQMQHRSPATSAH
jgi:hypothetical protein